MSLVKNAFLVLLLHQCIVNGFNILDVDFRLNYLNSKINAITPSFSPEKEIVTKWFLQELDHFNSKESRTFKMKYYEGLKYFRENGPIYIFLADEVHFSLAFGMEGIMKELAIESQGAMYVVEHRYHGDSKPFNNLDAENMQYLSSKQALADIAKLINFFKSLPMYKDSKVVVIGGFYSGNLAAWMKVLYPQLIDAAIASSAPILAKKDFYEYLEKVYENYENYGSAECVVKIKEKFKKYDSLLQSPEGIAQLKKDKNICGKCDMTVLENQQLFFMYETMVFKYISLYGSPDTIENHCQNFIDKIYYEPFIKKHSKVGNSEIEICMYIDFNELIDSIRDKQNDSSLFAWMYQSCTEFGYFDTTSSKKQPFLNNPLEFFIKICNGLFGENFNENRIDEGIANSNKLYGGLKPNISNVVFINGDMDPWSNLSILDDLSYDVQAIVIPREGAHCKVIYPSFLDESEELKKVRKYVKYLIYKWIRLTGYSN